MLKRPDEAVLRQLESLHGTAVHEWLYNSLLQTRKTNDTRQGVELGWGQGEAQTLDRIVEFIDKSEEFRKNSQRRESPGDDFGEGTAP